MPPKIIGASLTVSNKNTALMPHHGWPSYRQTSFLRIIFQESREYVEKISMAEQLMAI